MSIKLKQEATIRYGKPVKKVVRRGGPWEDGQIERLTGRFGSRWDVDDACFTVVVREARSYRVPEDPRRTIKVWPGRELWTRKKGEGRLWPIPAARFR